jgi:hypothetical protein
MAGRPDIDLDVVDEHDIGRRAHILPALEMEGDVVEFVRVGAFEEGDHAPLLEQVIQIAMWQSPGASEIDRRFDAFVAAEVADTRPRRCLFLWERRTLTASSS